MPWLELVWTIWRTLQANRLRATLTLLGVTTGVGTLVLLASVVGGGLAAIGRTVQEASGSDVIRARVEPWTERGEPAEPLTTADMRAVAEARGLHPALRTAEGALSLLWATLCGAWDAGAGGEEDEATAVWDRLRARARAVLEADETE